MSVESRRTRSGNFISRNLLDLGVGAFVLATVWGNYDHWGFMNDVRAQLRSEAGELCKEPSSDSVEQAKMTTNRSVDFQEALAAQQIVAQYNACVKVKDNYKDKRLKEMGLGVREQVSLGFATMGTLISLGLIAGRTGLSRRIG